MNFKQIGEMATFILEEEYTEYLKPTFANWQSRYVDVESFVNFAINLRPYPNYFSR